MVIAWPDVVNALIEFGAVVTNVLSIRRLWLDKEVKGIAPSTFGYWLLLSGWAVVLYATQPTLPLSYMVAWLVLASLAVYVGLIVWFRWKNH